MFKFKDYLMESKKTYAFKVKVCGDVPKDATTRMKTALAEFDPEKISSGKRTPIQETPIDFPEKKNVEVTSFNVELNYPTISPAVRRAVAHCLAVSEDCIKVRTPAEELEIAMNMAHAKVPGQGESLLTKDYENNDEGQKVVGQAHIGSFLKELQKTSADLKKATKVAKEIK